MSFWKKSMDYLGLGPDDAYDDYDDGPDPEPQARQGRSSRDDGESQSKSNAQPFVLADRAASPVGQGRAGAAELPVA